MTVFDGSMNIAAPDVCVLLCRTNPSQYILWLYCYRHACLVRHIPGLASSVVHTMPWSMAVGLMPWLSQHRHTLCQGGSAKGSLPCRSCAISSAVPESRCVACPGWRGGLRLRRELAKAAQSELAEADMRLLFPAQGAGQGGAERAGGGQHCRRGVAVVHGHRALARGRGLRPRRLPAPPAPLLPPLRAPSETM